MNGFIFYYLSNSILCAPLTANCREAIKNLILLKTYNFVMRVLEVMLLSLYPKGSCENVQSLCCFDDTLSAKGGAGLGVSRKIRCGWKTLYELAPLF